MISCPDSCVDPRGHDRVQAPAAVHRLGSCGGGPAPGYAYDISVMCPIFSISRFFLKRMNKGRLASAKLAREMVSASVSNMGLSENRVSLNPLGDHLYSA